MKKFRLLRSSLVLLSCAGLLVPHRPATADDDLRPAAGRQPLIHDVRLSDSGTLSGHLVDTSARPIAAELVLSREGRIVAQCRSDDQGRFAFRNVGGGLCRITIGQSAVACRAWTRAAAPPVAKDHLLIVGGGEAVRGQQPISALFTSPLFVGLVVAAAVAIPVAIHNAQNDEPSGS